MSKLNRRSFVQISAGALVTGAASRLVAATTEAPVITSQAGAIIVQAQNYAWQYTLANDRFTLFDAQHRAIVSGKMQPVVVVTPAARPEQRISTPGKVAESRVGPGKISFVYAEVNGDARVSFTWRFDQFGIWTDPVIYETQSAESVVSLHYFADVVAGAPMPSLHPTYLIVPGIVSGSTLSPILHNAVNLNQSFWLGRGSFIPGVTQQWALPVHFFCGFSTHWPGPERNLYTEGKSDAFTCGLADLPAGDLFLQLNQGQASPWIDYRGDLWKHQQGPGQLTLGATLLWTVAPGYYEAIAAYYQGLLHAGIIHRKQNSERKTAISLTPQFCTWGAQRERNKVNDKLDESTLNSLYSELKASGMKAGLFSIDDKWEGAYGNLQHSPDRFPHFEQFLARLRADGMRLGIWAAIMRCEHPADLGLTLDQMLQTPDGTPFVATGAGDSKYYILDFTQPEVAKVLTEVVRRFMRRYQPDVFKFDFGYELPSAATAAPRDKRYTGERLMAKGLEVVIAAMRAENPDIVVMYYNLSPLFLDYFDLHSPDDLYLDIGDYEVEANRRLYFSSLMGRLGVPTYGSSGYDWSSSPSIWFDSAALGTIGSLNDFGGDEQGEKPTPEIIARYNGITQVLRPTGDFEIVPIGTVQYAPTLGAHAQSWARFEHNELVLLAQRPAATGEENLLEASQPIDWRVKDALQSSVPVIVASKTSESIFRSANLAIVSCGGGEITLRRKQGSRAQLTSHYLRGESTTANAAIAGGQLRLMAVAHNSAGAPLEWIEVQID